ncbi:hypothetical protein ACIQVK_45685 [Streptomyces sp. NPDC090493]|uniref:hypothetical protein n=1 Tax=Streptomyces sp. NPDC090493 TaxID=3365964 RepID=UPI00381A34BE
MQIVILLVKYQVLGRPDPCLDWSGPMHCCLSWTGQGADGAVRAVEASLVAQGVDLVVVFLAQLCIQRDADDASGAGQSPSDLPVGDEFADGVLVGGSGCLAGSESVEGSSELVQVPQYCDDLAEGHADLSGGHVRQPVLLAASPDSDGPSRRRRAVRT